MVGDAFPTLLLPERKQKTMEKRCVKHFCDLCDFGTACCSCIESTNQYKCCCSFLLCVCVCILYPNTKPIKIVLPVFILLAGNQAINIGFFVRPFQSMSVKNILILKRAFFIQPLRTTSLLYTKPACIITVCGSKID